MPIDQTLIEQLTPQEKFDLANELWDELSETPEAVPVPQWHRDELKAASHRVSLEPGCDDSLGRSASRD